MSYIEKFVPEKHTPNEVLAHFHRRLADIPHLAQNRSSENIILIWDSIFEATTFVEKLPDIYWQPATRRHTVRFLNDFFATFSERERVPQIQSAQEIVLDCYGKHIPEIEATISDDEYLTGLTALFNLRINTINSDYYNETTQVLQNLEDFIYGHLTQPQKIYPLLPIIQLYLEGGTPAQRTRWKDIFRQMLTRYPQPEVQARLLGKLFGPGAPMSRMTSIRLVEEYLAEFDLPGSVFSHWHQDTELEATVTNSLQTIARLEKVHPGISSRLHQRPISHFGRYSDQLLYHVDSLRKPRSAFGIVLNGMYDYNLSCHDTFWMTQITQDIGTQVGTELFEWKEIVELEKFEQQLKARYGDQKATYLVIQCHGFISRIFPGEIASIGGINLAESREPFDYLVRFIHKRVARDATIIVNVCSAGQVGGFVQTLSHDAPDRLCLGANHQTSFMDARARVVDEQVEFYDVEFDHQPPKRYRNGKSVFRK